MAKITLDTVASGYDLSKVNANFQKIGEALNEKVLYRENVEGEPNTLESDVDANSKRIYNLAEPIDFYDAVNKKYLEDFISPATNPIVAAIEALLVDAETAATNAENSATASAASVSEAAAHETNAASSAATAATQATNAAASATTANTAKVAAESAQTAAEAAKVASEAAQVAAESAAGSALHPWESEAAGIHYDSGNVRIGGTGARIRGDFSNATLSNRVILQTSTENGNTNVHAAPNGSGVSSSFEAINSSDLANHSAAQLSCLGGEVTLRSSLRGSGSYLPLTFWTGGTEALRLTTDKKLGIGTTNPIHKLSVSNDGAEGLEIGPGYLSGRVLFQAFNRSNSQYVKLDVAAAGFELGSPYGLGYGNGAGGTVTQATSKSTSVTLNKPCGQITLHNSALAANTTVGFSLVNSIITPGDVVNVTVDSGTASGANYQVWSAIPGTGYTGIYIRNNTAGSLSEAVVLNFVVIKGASA